MEGADVSSIRTRQRRRLGDPGAGRAMPTSIASACAVARDLRHDRGLELPHDLATRTGRCTSAPVGHALPYSRVRVRRGRRRGQGGRATAPPDKIGVVDDGTARACSAATSPARPTRRFVEPGWVNSGDLGRIDANGYLWITGRAKDLIIRGGHNIDPLGDRGSAVRASRGRQWPPWSASPTPTPANCRSPIVAAQARRQGAKPAELLQSVRGRTPGARGGADAALLRRQHSAHGRRARCSSRRCAPTRRGRAGRPPARLLARLRAARAEVRDQTYAACDARHVDHEVRLPGHPCRGRG